MRRRRAASVAAAIALMLYPVQANAAASPSDSVASFHSLTASQQSKLRDIARDTWKFYNADVDPNTHLPLDNLTYVGGSATPTSFGRYTSASNVGVYLWAVVAASDMGLISRGQADARITATLHTVSRLKRDHGFLFQWYDTTTGHIIRNPGDIDCTTETTPTFDNCFFISNVDNGWYASGLIVARQALPELRPLVDGLFNAMDFGQFYDARAETHCNVNPAVTGNQPTGQMFGGYFVGLPPDVGDNWTHYFHYGALYSDPRISAYIGMGLHQMPGNVWWRSWRTLPPPAPFADCATTDPDFSWQGQWPVAGSWQTQTDPQSGQKFTVWEGHYTYTGSDLTFIPTFAGGMFEGLMANEVVPETSWGPHSFGLADVRTAQVQMKYSTEQLHAPVWGMSPSSVADDSGAYSGFGVSGQKFPYFGVGANADHPNLRLAQCDNCPPEDTVTPHASFIALDVAPQQAFANIEALRSNFPGVYGSVGFFDAVNPTTGSVGHRSLVLDQSMIMAALDNALENRAMQRHFADDPVSRAAKLYLSVEHMSLS
ncbi:MAG TPA: glucoamylase family protein [Mycobacterium sp.]|nr:glucoamylase family protein [Mycobacterium sp.]